VTDYGFTRISTGSQDAQTQERDIIKASPLAQIIRPDTKAASASKGEHLDKLDAVIAKLREGDRVIVTDSSRLDRRDNLTSQVETMLAIRKTGATIVSLAPGEETFANGDDLGSWVTTLVKQNANAEKSRTVKTQTRRGVEQIRDSKAHYGSLPRFWKTKGERYAKQAVCADPEAVRDIYRRIADGEPVLSVARRYGIFSQILRTLVCFEPNYTGLINESYKDLQWIHEVTPVVDSALWHRANKALDANHVRELRSKGGRPVAKPSRWISGVLSCPGCGGNTYLHTQKRMATRFRCGGADANRKACGIFKGADAQPAIDAIDAMFSQDNTEVLAFKRISGNAHKLDELQATLAALTAKLSAVDDDDELDRLVAERKRLRAGIASFEVIPDTFAYAPTGQTISEMWTQGDATVKRRMVRAVKATGEVALTPQDDGTWGVRVVFMLPGKHGEVIDLGGGLCFRRTQPPVLKSYIEAV